MSRKRRQGRAGPAGQVRIIGGRHRGRRLPIAELDGLRPTGDRQRETLFNWLQFELPGARVVDLFAGTGALGLEAASREAGRVWLVERHRAAVAALRSAVAQLDLDARVCAGDALAWLAETQDGPFDVVFVDPPFAADLWGVTLAALIRYDRLAQGAWVYVEAPRAWVADVPAQLELHKEKPGGDVIQRLYRFRPD